MAANHDEIDALEEELRLAPDDESVRHRLIGRYATDPDRHGGSRHVDHILWLLDHEPRSSFARTPVVVPDPESSLDGYHAIKERWLQLLEQFPDDTLIARGAANFFAASDMAKGDGIVASHARSSLGGRWHRSRPR